MAGLAYGALASDNKQFYTSAFSLAGGLVAGAVIAPFGPEVVPLGYSFGSWGAGKIYENYIHTDSRAPNFTNTAIYMGKGNYQWAINTVYNGDGTIRSVDSLGAPFAGIGSDSALQFWQNPVSAWDADIPRIDHGPAASMGDIQPWFYSAPIYSSSNGTLPYFAREPNYLDSGEAFPSFSSPLQFLQDRAAGSNGSSRSQLDVTGPGSSSFGNDNGDGDLPGNGAYFSVSFANPVTPGFGSGLFGGATSGLSGLFGDATSALGNVIGSANYSLGFIPNGFMIGANWGNQAPNINMPGFAAGISSPYYGGGSESGIGFNSLGDLGRMFGGFWSDTKAVFSSIGNFFDNIFGGIGDFFSDLFPVALDLNGDGVQLTPVTSSNTFSTWRATAISI